MVVWYNSTNLHQKYDILIDVSVHLKYDFSKTLVLDGISCRTTKGKYVPKKIPAALRYLNWNHGCSAFPSRCSASSAALEHVLVKMEGRSFPSPPHLDLILSRFVVDHRETFEDYGYSSLPVSVSLPTATLVPAALGKAAEVTDEQHLILSGH